MTNINDNIKIQEKYNWGVIGLIASLVFGLFGLYAYFNQLEPSMQYEVISESNVFDVHKPLDNLTILLNQEDIQKKNLNLKIYTIKISNNGYVNILQSDFDKNIAWGLEVNNAEIINEARFIQSNTEYLEKEIILKKLNNKIIEFSKIILEKDKYFSIELLVLHDKNILPTIKPIGKIVGIDEIKIVNSFEEDMDISLIEEIFYGNMFINFLRFIVYVVLTILFFMFLIFIGGEIEDQEKKNYKENRINSLKQIFDDELEVQESHLLYKLYKKSIKELEHIFQMCSEQDIEYLNEMKYISKEKQCADELKKINETRKLSDDDKYIMGLLAKNNCINFNGSIITVNTEFIQRLNKIIEYKKAHS